LIYIKAKASQGKMVSPCKAFCATRKGHLFKSVRANVPYKGSRKKILIKMKKIISLIFCFLFTAKLFSQSNQNMILSNNCNQISQSYNLKETYVPNAGSYEEIKTILVDIVVFGENDHKGNPVLSSFPFHAAPHIINASTGSLENNTYYSDSNGQSQVELSTNRILSRSFLSTII
jgi:hypothetical protein